MGLGRITQALGIEPPTIMAFGDSEMMLKCLKWLELSYAMENADDKAKAVATALAPANSQSGVLSSLGKLVRKRRMKWQYSY